MENTGNPATRLSTGAPERTLAALAIVVLGYALMQTLVVPALGLLRRELRTDASWSAWVLSAFLLSSAVLTPIAGRLGDQFGRRRVLLTVLGVNLVGTAGDAAAQTIGQLIAGRILQGASLAVLPLALAIARDTLPPARTGHGMGLLSGIVGAGAGLGLVLGGLLADHLSWRYLFVLGAALSALGIAVAARWVPADPPTTAPGRLDAPGAALLAAGLVALMLALTEGPNWGWASAPVLGLFAATVVVSVVLYTIERRTSDPMLDVVELRQRPLLMTHLAALVFGAASYVFYLVLPMYAELPGQPASYGFGATVLQAGLLMLPSALVLLPASIATGRVTDRVTARGALACGFAVIAAGSLLLALAHTAPWQHAAFYTLVGAGSGIVLAAAPRLIAAAVPASRMGTVTGFNNISRTVGGVVGTQLTAAVLASATRDGGTAPEPAAFTTLFWASAALACVGVVISMLARAGRAIPVTAPARAGPAQAAGHQTCGQPVSSGSAGSADPAVAEMPPPR